MNETAVPVGARARLTPYEVVFASPRYEAEVFPGLRAEAARANRREDQRDDVLMLRTAGERLRELPPDAAATSGDRPPASAVHEYAALLFQGFRFWSCGRHILSVGEAEARHVLQDERPLGDWELAPPQPAGYVQLPRHLIWSQVDEESGAESVDGFFWSVAGVAAGKPPWRRLDLLFVLGLRAERPGFSVIDVAAALCDAPSGHWGDLRARENEPDFANRLPGGELRGLFSLVSVAEALKLASRLFHAVATS